MKQKALAQECGWRPARISKYETGRTWPEEESVETLARKLKIPPKELRRTQMLLYDQVLTFEGQAERSDEWKVGVPPGNWIGETAAWASMDLDQRWQQLHRMEGIVRALRDQLQQETNKEQIRSALEDDGKS